MDIVLKIVELGLQQTQFNVYLAKVDVMLVILLELVCYGLLMFLLHVLLDAKNVLHQWVIVLNVIVLYF